MKFVCLGFLEQQVWDDMSTGEQDARIEECFAYDDELFRRGHWVDGGQALQSSRTAKTLRWKNGKVVVTDGPFAETKEQLGGIGVLEARDLDQAVELMSKHPGVQIGPFEIRPLDEAALCQMAATAERLSDEAVAPVAEAETSTFASLGYIPGNNWDALSASEQAAMLEECSAFDTARRRDGHWICGIALQGAGTAKTVRSKSDKVLVTDGPFAETKEQLGGVVVNRFKDMQHAIELLSTHPVLRFGVVIEIRPIDEEFNARWEARYSRLKKG
jgi:hypothetical protein